MTDNSDEHSLPSLKPGRRAKIERSGDLTNHGVRNRRESEEPLKLWGAEIPFRFLVDNLINSMHSSRLEPLFSVPRVLLLYGRKGVGKNTILHSRVPENREQYIFLDRFSEVYHWKMRPWNYTKFLEWVDTAIPLLNDQGSLLFVIQNVDFLTNLRDPVYLNAMIHFLTAVRCMKHLNDIRVILLSNEIPTMLSPEVRSLIDNDCYVPTPEPHTRCELILYWMRYMFDHSRLNPSLRNLTWSIELSDKEIEADPDHIVNLLSVASSGATPRQIYEYMKRVNDACAHPNPDGSTDYNEDLLTMMLYNVEGGQSIVPYNIEAENTPFKDYLKTNTVTNNDMNILKVTAGSGGNAEKGGGEEGVVDPLDQPIIERDPETKKRKNTSHLTEILEKRSEDREKQLQNAAKRVKEDEKRKNKRSSEMKR